MSAVIVGTVKAQTATLTGSLVSNQGLIGQLTQEAHLTGNLATAYSTASVKYEGDYEVTPTVNGMELETQNKFMADDLKINAIPFFEVENTSGGNTVYIAGEIEME